MNNIFTQKKQILLIFSSLLIFSCHYNSTYKNRESDKIEAEKITNQFYTFMKKDDYESTFQLFSKKFFAVTDTAKLKSIYITTKEKLGNMVSIGLFDWETEVIQGTDKKVNI